MQNYHRMMNVILDDLVKCQNTDGIVTSIIVDNTPCGVTLKVPVAFVVGDCEGNDKLCGRFGTHSLGNILVCRDCDCPTMQADNPGVVCSPITIQTIFSARDDLVALKLLSHHNIDNAFHKLSFGGDPEGIHGCSPPEMLHLYQQGLYKYALESFVNSLTSEQRRSLDQLVAKVSDNCYHQSDRTFPRFRFPRGITNLSCFTAAEQVGVTLVCFLAIAMQEFESIILCYNISKRNYSIDPNAVARCKQFMKLFEAMLVAESWINQEHHSAEQVPQHASTAITHLMHQYKNTINWTEGNGLKLPKFHQLKHMPRYILKFGSPANFNTSRCESHHIHLSKKPAKTAQKRDDCFEQQVGHRIVDSIVLSRATQSMIYSSSKTPPFIKAQISGTRFSIIRLGVDDNFSAVSCSNCSDSLPFDQVILNNFGNSLHEYFSTNDGIPCFTEHYRMDEVNQEYVLFRAHPCFRGKPWNDWAHFQWDKDAEDDSSDNSYDEIPAKILFFLDARDIKDHISVDPGLYAVVQSLTRVPFPLTGSKILRKAAMDPKDSFRLCHVDSIVDVAFVIPNIGAVNQYYLIAPPLAWAKAFIN